MTDEDKSLLTPIERQLTDELTRIANRQMQVVERLDSIQDKLARGAVTSEELRLRIEHLEEQQKRPAELMQRILVPLMIVSLTLTTGNIALTLAVSIALINHMLGK